MSGAAAGAARVLSISMSMLKSKLRFYFITGILTLLPLVVSFLVLSYVYHVIFNILKLFPTFDLPYNLGVLINLGILFVIIMVLGFVMDNYFGKRLHFHFEDRLVSRIPVIRLIYGSTKQLIDVLSVKEKGAFMKAVFVEYPRKGVYSLGFITKESEMIHNKDMVGVLVPTPPNPFSGALVFFEKADILDAGMPVKDALKIVTFGGIIGKEKK